MSDNGADMRSPIFYEVMLHEAKRSVKQDESKNEGLGKEACVCRREVSELFRISRSCTMCR
jgi:hypothetical protein